MCEMVNPRKKPHFYTSLCHTNVIFLPQKRSSKPCFPFSHGNSTEKSTQSNSRANLVRKNSNYPHPLGTTAPRQGYNPARHRNEGILHLLLII